jgi:hypothetical protein
MADSNSVYLLVGFNSGLKRDYGSKTRERKNSDTKDRSLDVASALPFVAMLSRRGIYIPPNGLVVLGCRMNVRIWRARVVKDRCLNMNIRRGDIVRRSLQGCLNGRPMVKYTIWTSALMRSHGRNQASAWMHSLLPSPPLPSPPLPSPPSCPVRT